MTARDHRLPPIALSAIAILTLIAGLASAQPQELPARIVTIGGRVEVSRKATPAWTSAALRDEVFAGDAVRAITGRVTLQTGSGQALRLAPRTQLAFAAADTPGRPTLVRMDGGRLWISVFPNSPAPILFELNVGPVTVTALGGGVGIVTNPDGSVLVSVYHGTVACAGEGWQRVLVQDQEVLVPAAGVPKEVTPLKRDKRDVEWVKWNEQQDSAGGYGARVEKK